jgi:hypothetical protein
MFLFKTEGMINYTYSKLDDEIYEDQDYRLVLRFLKGDFSYDKINESSMCAKTPEEINKIIHSITGIKP